MPKLLPTTPVVTVADMRRHAETLCRDHDIVWTQPPKMRLHRSWSSFELEEICTPPIRGPISYATVLHEIGHILGRHRDSRRVMVRETWAWRWARDNALGWTPAMARSMQAAQAYIARNAARMDRDHPWSPASPSKAGEP